MMSKSKIRLRESRAIGGELGVRIVEGGNGLCMMFKPQCVHILHYLTKPRKPVVIEMSFPYTDREDFIEKLYEWCDFKTFFRYREEEHSMLEIHAHHYPHEIVLHYDDSKRSHSLSLDFITNFKQQLKTKLEQEVIEVIYDNPMPKPQSNDVAIIRNNYWNWEEIKREGHQVSQVTSIYRPKNGKLELIWSREG